MSFRPGLSALALSMFPAPSAEFTCPAQAWTQCGWCTCNGTAAASVSASPTPAATATVRHRPWNASSSTNGPASCGLSAHATANATPAAPCRPPVAQYSDSTSRLIVGTVGCPLAMPMCSGSSTTVNAIMARLAASHRGRRISRTVAYSWPANRRPTAAFHIGHASPTGMSENGVITASPGGITSTGSQWSARSCGSSSSPANGPQMTSITSSSPPASCHTPSAAARSYGLPPWANMRPAV